MIKNRVIMIGLDGGTFEVINPLIEEGELPTFRFLKENGVHAVLLSTIPSITGPAWLALATGKNPGQTGIIDFYNLKKKGDFKLYPITSEDFKTNGAIWDYVSNVGGKVCVYNYPMLYPPYEVNGIMISGLGAPENLKQIVYPPELVTELKSFVKNYRIIVPYNRRKYTHKKDLFLKDLNRLLKQNIKIIKFLLEKEKWDLFIGVISATDFLQHYMWDVWESYKCGKQEKFVEEFIKIWKKIDELIKFIVETNKDTNFFIVSDHGFGELKYLFSINKWLKDKGYLIIKKNTTKHFVQANILNKLKLYLEILPSSLFNLLRKTFGKKGYHLIKLHEIVDFQKSKAFALDHAAYGHIYINHVGRNPKAPIRTKDELLKLREQIVNELKAFVENSNMLNEIEIFYPENIYTGDKISFLPDIFFNIDKMACEISPTNFDYTLKKYENPNKTGTHRREGIFIAYGPIIKSGINLKEINLIDIVPTILYMMGIPVPHDVDGKILRKIFTEKVSVKVKTIFVDIEAKSTKNKDVDEERIKKQLKDLGYL